MSTDREADYKSSEEIEEEVNAARRRVTETVEAIEDKLSPGQLIDKVLPLFRQSGASATMAHYGKALGHSAQANPVPFLLVGAGLAWMALTSSQGNNRVPPHPPANASDDPESEGLVEKAREALLDSVDAVREGVGHATDTARERMHDARDKAQSTFETVTNGTRNAAADAMQGARKSVGQVQQLALEHPLILGLVGFTLGAAIGAAMPSTDFEDKAVGDYSDKLKSSVETVAKDQIDKAGEILSAAAGAAKDTAQDAGLTVDQGAQSAGSLVDKLERVGEAALDAAKQEVGTIRLEADQGYKT